MAKKWSTGLVDFIAAKGSLRQAVANARLLLFGGTAQPASADAAATGATLLATLTKGGEAFTGETKAEWKTTLTGVAGTLAAVILGALVRSGTAQAAGASTLTLDAGASATDDAYNGMYLMTTGGTGAGQCRRITDYGGDTKEATVDAAWDTAPDATTTFELVSGVDLMSAAVPFDSDLATTAANAAEEINNTITFPDLEAYSSVGNLFVRAPRATGSLFNGLRLFTAAAGGLTSTVANAGLPQTWGTDGANGINWSGVPVSGQIDKEAATMQGSYGANGTLAWFRFVFDPADDGLSASSVYPRLDGDIAVSGADLIVGNTTAESGAPVVIDTFPLSVLTT